MMIGRTSRRNASRPHRAGFALLDVIVGGLILGLGLTVVLSITSRSLSTQTRGEKRVIASWLLDELLTMVLADGPVMFPKQHETSGRFDGAFSEFQYDVSIEDQGVGQPFLVTARVNFPTGRGMDEVRAQTYIADGGGASVTRKPTEPFDRYQRWLDKQEAARDQGR